MKYFFCACSNVEYEKEGVKHMRMKFYLEGPHRKGTAQLEAKKVGKNYHKHILRMTSYYVNVYAFFKFIGLLS